MKYAWILCLMFVGCDQAAPVVPLDPPGYGNNAVSVQQTMTATAQGTGSYNILKQGVAMGVIRWKASIKNTATVNAVRLVVDILDAKGAIIAETDKTVVVKSGETYNDTGDMDVPTAVIEKMAKLSVYLALDNEKGIK